METDSDYDVSADYLDPERLSSYDETMMLRTAQRVGQRDSQRHAEAAERLPAQNFERRVSPPLPPFSLLPSSSPASTLSPLPVPRMYLCVIMLQSAPPPLLNHGAPWAS